MAIIRTFKHGHWAALSDQQCDAKSPELSPQGVLHLLVQEVCPCIRITSMMHYVHSGEAVVTSIKIDIFMFVTTRPIAHSRQFACIRNCIGEFSMDTGQPLVTTNRM